MILGKVHKNNEVLASLLDIVWNRSNGQIAGNKSRLFFNQIPVLLPVVTFPTTEM